MKKSAFKDNRGLTLVELMVGVTILAIIAVPLLNAFVIGAGTQMKSHKYGEATDAAQNLVEQIQATDADAILSNATVVNLNALYYTSSNLSTGTNGVIKKPTADNGKYYIGIPNYSYGGSAFNALITLDASDSVNGTPVVAGNQMDALLNMSKADERALNELKTQYGSLMKSPDELTKSLFERTITFTVSKRGTSSPYDYTIDVEFMYSTDTITATTLGSKRGTEFFFTHLEQSSASVGSVADSTDGSPVLSAFLFFDGYYKSNISGETVIINNLTGSYINVFLVNTNKETAPAAGYKVDVLYNHIVKNQPVDNLVFTNLAAGEVSYNAVGTALPDITIPVTGYLVETKQLNRKYNVNVKLFQGGTGFTGTPVLNIDSTKLNY